MKKIGNAKVHSVQISIVENNKRPQFGINLNILFLSNRIALPCLASATTTVIIIIIRRIMILRVLWNIFG